jgi:hypothetical protein
MSFKGHMLTAEDHMAIRALKHGGPLTIGKRAYGRLGDDADGIKVVACSFCDLGCRGTRIAPNAAVVCDDVCLDLYEKRRGHRDDPEPKRPEPSEGVRVWFELHEDANGTPTARVLERNDLDEITRAYLTTCVAWDAEYDAWCERQPIDFSTMRRTAPANGWRMFGGPWIRHQYEYEQTDIPVGDDTFVRVFESPIKAAQDALARLGRSDFIGWAHQFYEFDAARTRAQVAFTMHLRDGAGRPPL